MHCVCFFKHDRKSISFPLSHPLHLISSWPWIVWCVHRETLVSSLGQDRNQWSREEEEVSMSKFCSAAHFPLHASLWVRDRQGRVCRLFLAGKIITPNNWSSVNSKSTKFMPHIFILIIVNKVLCKGRINIYPFISCKTFCITLYILRAIPEENFHLFRYVYVLLSASYNEKIK